MAITNATLHIVDGLGLPLDKTLRRINDSVSEANNSGMFVTLFVARVNLKTRHMEYCNAGHCPILIFPPDGEPYYLKAKPNLAIGLFKDFAYEAEEIDLKAGTRIITYTDGVTEAEKKDLSQYGKDRLMQWAKHIVETFPETSPHADNSREKTIVEDLYASVNAFAAGNPQNDDITIMSVRIE
jgi:sigma-B regulation protein RsbU (phosphoserine phosphatase)